MICGFYCASTRDCDREVMTGDSFVKAKTQHKIAGCVFFVRSVVACLWLSSVGCMRARVHVCHRRRMTMTDPVSSSSREGSAYDLAARRLIIELPPIKPKPEDLQRASRSATRVSVCVYVCK